MKRLILFTCFLALLQQISGNDTLKIGYLVVIEKNGKIQPPLKTEQLSEVYTFIQVHFPEFFAELESELKNSPVFIQTTANNEIYIEKKRVVNGKYKRLKSNNYAN